MDHQVDLFDRSLLPGDVIKRLNVDGGQRGIVCNSNVELTCKIVGTQQVVTKVESKKFINGIGLSPDILFYYRNWVGIIEDVQCQLVLTLPDGSVARMKESEILKFKDISSERSCNSEFDDFSPYVGQQFMVPARVFPHCDLIMKTISQDTTDNYIIVTVMQIQVEKVQVHWLCCLETAQNKLVDFIQTLTHFGTPNTVIEGCDLKDIVQLDYFKNGSIEMGDRGVYILNEEDRIVTYRAWCQEVAKETLCQKLSSELYTVGSDDDDSDYSVIMSDDEDTKPILTIQRFFGKKFGVSIKKIREKHLDLKPSKLSRFPRKPIEFNPGSHLPVEVIATKTFVDVIWQDGSIERGISSCELYPIHHLDGHEYFPGDYVVKSKSEFSHNLYGVIQNIDHGERTGKVKWFEVGSNQRPQFVSEEEVSVYDLEDHPDFNFRPGSCVARLPTTETEKLSAAARAGQVVVLKTSGFIECVWADGSRSEVTPQELYLIGDYDDDDLWADEEDDEDMDEDEEVEYPARSREPKTPPSTLKRSSSSNSPVANDREIIDRLRKSMDGLEDWFNQFPTLNGQNGHVVVRKLNLLMENLEAVDTLKNTSLTASKDFRELLESVRLPAPCSSIHANINWKLNKLIKSLSKRSTDCNLSEQGDTNKMVCEGAASEAESSPISTKTRHSLDILKKLKTQLFTACSSSESTNMDVNGAVTESEKIVEGNDVPASVVNGEKDSSKPCPSFLHVDHVPDTHKFKLSIFQTSNPRSFFTRVRKEIELLQTSLPKDIMVKGFEDRMDLFSVMIKGPSGTPYEDALFLFDVQLPAGYPNVPPLVHYIPFCRDRLNPNLYESGKVCVSLLGTWSGKGSEQWSPIDSTLLQLFISIQGLILVPEPYFNEAGYTRQKGTSSGDENSRLYNEMAVVKVVESMTRMIASPPEPFRDEIISHVKSTSKAFVDRLESWIQISQTSLKTAGDAHLDFPLLPASKGFCLSLTSALQSLRTVLSKLE